MNRKFIHNFTPTGMIPTKNMTPNVPVQPHEIVEEVLAAAELGVNMAHIHARNGKSDEPAYEKEVYADITSGIRKKTKDLIICVFTSGRTHSEFEQRSQVLNLTGELKPDFGSLTLSSLNFNKQASINSPDMINYAKYLIGKKLIKPPY